MKRHKLIVLALLSTSSLLYPVEAGNLDWLTGSGNSLGPSAGLCGKKNSSPTQGNSGRTTPEASRWNHLIQETNRHLPPQGSNGSPHSTLNGIKKEDSLHQQARDIGGGTDAGENSKVKVIAPQTSWGKVYNAAIVRSGVNEECTERILLSSLDEKTWQKMLTTKCRPGPGCYSCQPIRNEGKLLLIGSSDEHMCVFTTNPSEIYYLIDGKWRKGSFDQDNSKDTELTVEEIVKIKERVQKWRDYFEKSHKEKERIKGLIKEEKNKYHKERDRIENLEKKETDETRKRNYEKELSKLENRYRAEENKLEVLLTEQNMRVSQDVEENIKQEW